MKATSKLYKQIIASGNFYTENKLVIGSQEFREDTIISCKTRLSAMGTDLNIGMAMIGRIDAEILKPKVEIPTNAKISLYVRACDSTRQSEWIESGHFWLDTREEDESFAGIVALKIVGYDAMAYADADCPTGKLPFPALDVDVVKTIASSIGVEVDPATLAILTMGYRIPTVEYYSGREILGYIAGAYGGNFVISDTNKLRLVRLVEPTKDSGTYLSTSGAERYHITIGGVRIRV